MAVSVQQRPHVFGLWARNSIISGDKGGPICPQAVPVLVTSANSTWRGRVPSPRWRPVCRTGAPERVWPAFCLPCAQGVGDAQTVNVFSRLFGGLPRRVSPAVPRVPRFVAMAKSTLSGDRTAGDLLVGFVFSFDPAVGM